MAKKIIINLILVVFLTFFSNAMQMVEIKQDVVIDMLPVDAQTKYLKNNIDKLRQDIDCRFDKLESSVSSKFCRSICLKSFFFGATAIVLFVNQILLIRYLSDTCI